MCNTPLKYMCTNVNVVQFICGLGSSVSIATDYGLDDLGSNPKSAFSSGKVQSSYSERAACQSVEWRFVYTFCIYLWSASEFK